MNLADAASLLDERARQGIIHPAHVHARTVVEQDLQLFRVVDGLAAHLRVYPAGVVAEHAAEGAVIVRRGIGRVRQLVAAGGPHDLVADHPGSTRANRSLGLISSIRFMCFDQSRTTAALQV